MLRLKVITYTQDLINKSTIDSIVLLTKDGKQMSILTGSEYGNVQEYVALYDASLKTFIIENPVISGTTEYDEAAMLEMFDGASILYGDVSYNGDSLFADEIWIRKISLRNDERCISIDRAIPRNFWHFAFGPFKEQQRYEHRDFDACLRKAMEDFQYHDLEGDPTEYDTDDMLRITRAIAHDVWGGTIKWSNRKGNGTAPSQGDMYTAAER